MKYIIKNCPQCIEYTDGANRFFICQTTNTYCQITENCLLKRIAEDCGLYSPDGGFNDPEAQDLANLILDKLEIEEVE